MSGKRLHVVFVDHVARLSGGEIALVRLLPELSKHVDVTVILGEEGPLVERLHDNGVAVELMPLDPRLRDLRKDTLRPAAVDLRALSSLPGYILELRTRIRALDADIVHTNSLKAAFYGAAAGRLAGVPIVWHIRDRIAADYLPPPAVRLVRLASRFLPTAVIANSRETMSTVPLRRDRRVIYNAIVPDSVEAPTGGHHCRPAAAVVGMIGRLTPWKGQDVFLDAFAQAFRGRDVRARLIGSAMFGEDAYADSLRQRAQMLGIEGQVEFRGFRENIWAELQHLDVLVHCSVRPEPFGQVVLEGLAAGVPVVAAAAGGPAEIVTDGVDGLLTTPGKPDELADALRRLVAEPDLRKRLGAAGRHRSRDFSPQRTVSQLLAIYEQVAANSHGRGARTQRR